MAIKPIKVKPSTLPRKELRTERVAAALEAIRAIDNVEELMYLNWYANEHFAQVCSQAIGRGYIVGIIWPGYEGIFPAVARYGSAKGLAVDYVYGDSTIEQIDVPWANVRGFKRVLLDDKSPEQMVKDVEAAFTECNVTEAVEDIAIFLTHMALNPPTPTPNERMTKELASINPKMGNLARLGAKNFSADQAKGFIDGPVAGYWSWLRGEDEATYKVLWSIWCSIHTESVREFIATTEYAEMFAKLYQLDKENPGMVIDPKKHGKLD